MISVAQAKSARFQDKKLTVRTDKGWIVAYGIAGTYDTYDDAVSVKAKKGLPVIREKRIKITDIVYFK